MLKFKPIGVFLVFRNEETLYNSVLNMNIGCEVEIVHISRLINVCLYFGVSDQLSLLENLSVV